MTWADILAALSAQRVQALAWVLGSIALYLGWGRLWARRNRKGPADRLARLLAALDRPWLVEAARFVFYIGIPYLALLRGVINPRVLGLTHLDWFIGLGYGAPLGAGALLLCTVLWQQILEARPALAAPLTQEAVRFAKPWGWSYTLVEVIYLQAHWAFYRAAAFLLSGDPYLGSFVGLGLVALETSLDPRPEDRLQRGYRLWRLSLALVTAVLFYFTLNLWLTAAVHITIEMAVLGLIGARRPSPQVLEREE